MTRVGLYSPDTAKRILSVVNDLQSRTSAAPQVHPQQGYIFRTPSGGIAAGAKELCTQQRFDGNDDLIDMLNDNGDPIQRQVKNIFSGDIGGDAIIVVLRMYGRLCAIAEDCP